jgi:hypothetical protein
MPIEDEIAQLPETVKTFIRDLREEGKSLKQRDFSGSVPDLT